MECTYHNSLFPDAVERYVSIPGRPPVKEPKTVAPALDIPDDTLRFVRERLAFEPDEKQIWILTGHHRRLLVNCSRQWGKSTITAAKALHLALLRPEALVLVSAPTGRQSALFVEKVEQFVRKLGIRVRGDSNHTISVTLPNKSRIIGLPGASEDNIRGFSGAAMLIVDEAARVDDALYYAARPILAASGGDIWLLSTPKGKRGFFYQEWTHGGDTWERVSAPATECSRIPPDSLEEERRTMGEDWVRQEYLCEFVDFDGSVFARDVVERAFRTDLKPLSPGP